MIVNKIALKIIVIILFLATLFGCKKIHPKNELAAYLKTNGKLPKDYVVEKFKSNDYVFIGEFHRIKHNVDLILELIPEMHKNGIYNLAIEFGDYKDQYLVDSLLSLPYFDRKLARKIMFNCSPDWGYKEYIDIYEEAWKVNQSSEKKFRVLNLAANYNPCKKGGAWKNLDPDVFMADIIFKELVSKNKKALIFSGNHHAFTKYHQPIYSFKKDSLYGSTNKRMGNIVYDSLQKKVFNIYLHAGWVSNKGWDEPFVLPVNGAIDSIMRILGDKPVGFDVLNSPFGKLTCNDSYYAFGYPDFTLEKYCDGYIYQKAFKDYMPITMEENFITKENINSLKQYLTCNEEDSLFVKSITIKNANKKFMEQDIDIRNYFKHFTK